MFHIQSWFHCMFWSCSMFSNFIYCHIIRLLSSWHFCVSVAKIAMRSITRSNSNASVCAVAVVHAGSLGYWVKSIYLRFLPYSYLWRHFKCISPEFNIIMLRDEVPNIGINISYFLEFLRIWLISRLHLDAFGPSMDYRNETFEVHDILHSEEVNDSDKSRWPIRN